MTSVETAGFRAEEKEELANRLRRCLEAHPEVVFAYVHGSFVTADCYHDLDVAVLLETVPDSPLQTELALERELGNGVGRLPVDVRVLNHAPLSFSYNVVRYGVPLLVRDDDRRSDFVAAVLTNYFDFAPFRRQYLKETLGLAI